MKNNLWKKGFCILACATLLTSMAADAALPDYVYAATTKEFNRMEHMALSQVLV